MNKVTSNEVTGGKAVVEVVDVAGDIFKNGCLV